MRNPTEQKGTVAGLSPASSPFPKRCCPAPCVVLRAPAGVTENVAQGKCGSRVCGIFLAPLVFYGYDKRNHFLGSGVGGAKAGQTNGISLSKISK